VSDTTTDPAPEATDASTEAAEAAPTDELREGLLATLSEELGDRVLGSHIQPGRELWVRVARDAWVEAARVAKERLGCTFFDYLSAIDWKPSPWGRYEDALLDVAAPGEEPANATATTTTAGDTEATGTEAAGTEANGATAGYATGVAGGATRFQVMCRLTNLRRHCSVVLKADVGDGGDDEVLRIGSLVPLFAGANWHERECWEMFGIAFDGHPSLRHLYLPGAFEGHPLRKDFPLLARLVKPWPGIVDVEPMPEPATPPEGTTTEGDTAEGDAIAAGGSHGESVAPSSEEEAEP
jgi:NADH-quinone oxidoreductase subunit C